MKMFFVGVEATSGRTDVSAIATPDCSIVRDWADAQQPVDVFAVSATDEGTVRSCFAKKGVQAIRIEPLPADDEVAKALLPERRPLEMSEMTSIGSPWPYCGACGVKHPPGAHIAA